MDWAKKTARLDETHFSFVILCDLYYTFYGNFNDNSTRTVGYKTEWDLTSVDILWANISSSITILQLAAYKTCWTSCLGNEYSGIVDKSDIAALLDIENRHDML